MIFFDARIEGVVGVCSLIVDGTSKQLLNASNYGYNLVGISIPCIIMFVISIIIMQRTCTNKRYDEKVNNSFKYMAATIGIIHSIFNFTIRLSDILVLLLSPYSPFFSYLISFNHEIQAVLSLSYAYKCLICILISRRYRYHAKNILCFLIENKYEERMLSRKSVLLKTTRRQTLHYLKNYYSLRSTVSFNKKKFLSTTYNKCHALIICCCMVYFLVELMLKRDVHVFLFTDAPNSCHSIIYIKPIFN